MDRPHPDHRARIAAWVLIALVGWVAAIWMWVPDAG